nr:nucleotidyltransferase domain-containing protein [Lysinibacillus timonensis]
MDFNQIVPSHPTWLHTQIILLGQVGSHAYGTATTNSDLDFKGVCIPPAEYFMGLQSFEGYDKMGGKNFKNQAGDIDVTIIHINKFVRDATAGVPNNLELLFLDQSDYLHVDQFGQELIGMREQFLSKRIMKKYGGYAKSQAQKLKQRTLTGLPHGYDTKLYMHTVRLLEMAIEILNERTLTVKRHDAAHLLSLREGAHTRDEAFSHIADLEIRLNQAFEQSILPENPNIEVINNWLVDFNMRHIQSR